MVIVRIISVAIVLVGIWLIHRMDRDIDKAINEMREDKKRWIPVSEQLPKVETNVFICAKRKYCGGESRYIYTVAMYEDGTVLENDSTWNWEALDGVWDEDEECYIIPEGWWESTQYHPDGVLNSPVSDEVIAWMPLPESYKAE